MANLSERREHLPQLNSKLAEEPIALPENPFKTIAITLGRDELVALGMNASATALLGMISSDPALLSLSGPVVEKAGLFAFSCKEELEIYRTTPKEDREQKSHYLKEALKKGLPSFWRDLIGHDPTYTASMLYGIHAFPDTPVWMLSAITFIGAIGVVAVGDVSLKELSYARQVKKLTGEGFIGEPHLEAKFLVNTDEHDDPERLVAEIAQVFDLGEVIQSSYHDRYFVPSLKSYNAREPAFRIRNRTSPDGSLQSRTAQVIYTRASQISREKPDQYNFFPRNKDKFRLPFDEEIPENIGEIQDEGVRRTLERLVKKDTPSRDIFVARDYASATGRLLVSVDRIQNLNDGRHTEIELKTYRGNKNAQEELITAMRYVMSKYSVIQTTHDKRTLVQQESE